ARARRPLADDRQAAGRRARAGSGPTITLKRSLAMGIAPSGLAHDMGPSTPALCRLLLPSLRLQLLLGLECRHLDAVLQRLGPLGWQLLGIVQRRIDVALPDLARQLVEQLDAI